jgi:MGT family glycosyltransferase
MARILFTVWPFPGHVNPALGVAKALQSRGHEVGFYTGSRSVPLVEGEGFSTFPFRRIPEERIWGLIQGLEARSPIDRTPLKLLRAVFREWLSGTIPQQVADIREVIADWAPDAVVTDPMMWGPSLILLEADHLRVAVMAFFIGCPLPGREAPPWGPGLPPPRSFGTRLLTGAANFANDIVATGLRRELDTIRAGYGLPPMGCSVNAFSARLPLYLIPSVRELDYGRRDLPPSVHYVGPCTWDRPSGQAPDGWLEGLPAGQPWVHVTEGTAHYQDPFVLRAAASGLAGLPLQAILTTGSQREPSGLGLGPAASNVHVRRWVSHSELLPRCAALVTTGGAGTVMAALQAGVPQLIVPTRWDKPDNARRVVEAGAGLRLAPGKCTPGRLRKGVERLLSEPEFGRNARRLSNLLAAAPGPTGAAKLIESLIGQPSVASPA